MGFFDGVDIEEIPDNPSFVEDGDHYAKVTKAVTAATAKGDKTGLTLSFTITEGSYAGGFPINRWYEIPQLNGRKAIPAELRHFSILQKIFVSLGFGVDELEDVTDTTLLNRECVIRTKMKPNKGMDDELMPAIIGVYPISDIADADMEAEFTDTENNDSDVDHSDPTDDDI